LAEDAGRQDTKESHVTQWDAESLRLTAFVPPLAHVDELTWWSNMTGYPPESRVWRSKLGELTEIGPYEGKNLILVVRPGRVDWQMAPLEQGEPGDELPMLGSYSESIEAFVGLMKQWLPLSPPVQRLAFGAVLLRPAKDRLDGYKMLSAYLPFVKLDAESSDFGYQINRPRKSSTDLTGLKINRLSKWSVMARLGLMFSLVGQELARQHASPVATACRLEVDINTSPDFAGELPKEKLSAVLDELIALATEIATKGEV
jgi:hypothetical protein